MELVNLVREEFSKWLRQKAWKKDKAKITMKISASSPVMNAVKSHDGGFRPTSFTAMFTS